MRTFVTSGRLREARKKRKLQTVISKSGRGHLREVGAGMAQGWGAGMAQWWEHLPPTNVARVRFPDSVSYVGWVCCWFSSLLWEVFLRVLRFSPLLKNQHFQIPIRSGLLSSTLSWASGSGDRASTPRAIVIKFEFEFEKFGSRLREAPTIVIWLRNICYFGKMGPQERWSLTRGGRKGRFDCILILELRPIEINKTKRSPNFWKSSNLFTRCTYTNNGLRSVHSNGRSDIETVQAPSTLMRFRLKTHTFWCVSPIVHTRTPENANKNGDFRKRFH